MSIYSLLSVSNMFLNRLEISRKRTRLLSRPLNLALEPTLKCNSNCVMCNRNFSRLETKKAESFLSRRTFERVRPLFKYTMSVLFGGFGEALLHPEYIPMLREMKKECRFVFTYSNAILMTEDLGRGLVDAGMDRICVSIGGATRETYRRIRGVDKHDVVVENLRRINEYKKKRRTDRPDIFLEVVAMESVLPELEDVIELARELGVRNVSMPNMVAQGPELLKESVWHDTESAKKAFGRAGERAQRYGINFSPPNLDANFRTNCNSLFDLMVVNWDGTVMSCARERYVIGDLKTSTPEEIWNGKGLRDLRREFFEKGLERVCPGCSCWDNSPDNFLKPSINSREYAIRL